MPTTMRVSLPGYDCLTDSTIDHYSIYADSDNILIKEKSRGTINVPNTTAGTVSHNLGYIPLYFVYSQVNTKKFRIASGYDPLGAAWKTFVGTADLTIRNSFGTAGSTSQYYIFYDNLP